MFSVNFSPFVNNLNILDQEIEGLQTQLRHLIEPSANIDCNELKEQACKIKETKEKVEGVVGSLRQLGVAIPIDVRRQVGTLYSKIESMEDSVRLTKLNNGAARLPVSEYIAKKELENREVILGCGHDQERPEHFHEGQYCVDIGDLSADAQLDVTSSVLMKYLPTNSFNKVVLEYLPITIFNYGKADITFEECHRILVSGGVVEFNDMMGISMGQDSGNPFNCVLTGEEIQGVVGKRITDLPDILQRYNEKVRNFLLKIGFSLPIDFDTRVYHSSWVATKL